MRSIEDSQLKEGFAQKRERAMGEPKIVVQKYGGSSVADLSKLKQVALHIEKTTRKGFRVVVVVSAMGKTTDELIRMA